MSTLTKRIPIKEAADALGMTIEQLEDHLSTLSVDYDRKIDGPLATVPPWVLNIHSPE